MSEYDAVRLICVSVLKQGSLDSFDALALNGYKRPATEKCSFEPGVSS
jgi:hypothetical protein